MPISLLWVVLYSTFVIYFYRFRTCFCCSSRSLLTDANISPAGCSILDLCYLFSKVQDLLLLFIQKPFNRCQYLSLLLAVLYSTFVIYFHRSRTCFCCLSRSSSTDAYISPVGCTIFHNDDDTRIQLTSKNIRIFE